MKSKKILAVVAGIMLIGVGGAMAEKGEDPVTVVEDQEISEIKDVPRETPVVKEFDPSAGLAFLQTMCDENSDDNITFDCTYKEEDGQKIFCIVQYNANVDPSDIATIEMGIKLGKVTYEGVNEVMNWDYLKGEANNLAIVSLAKLHELYPNDNIHMGVMIGTNEDHIYLTSLDGTIVYDVFAN